MAKTERKAFREVRPATKQEWENAPWKTHVSYDRYVARHYGDKRRGYYSTAADRAERTDSIRRIEAARVKAALSD